MNTYIVKITEEIVSVIEVDAENECEAFDIAKEEIDKDFRASYHEHCDMTGYDVKCIAENID